MPDSAEIVCSAPGKVLAAGGYLILDRPNTGMVFALSARFYSSVRLVGCAAGAGELVIDVYSPQFADHRRYRFGGGLLEVIRQPLPTRAERDLKAKLAVSLSLPAHHSSKSSGAGDCNAASYSRVLQAACLLSPPLCA